MGDVGRLQSEIELWFLDATERMSIIYRNKIMYLLLLLGFVISFVLNADAIMITNTLSIAPTVRSAVSKMVEEEINKPRSAETLQRQMEVAQTFQTLVQDLQVLGWSRMPGSRRGFPFSLKGLVLKLLGFSITAVSIMFIGPCLFELLNRFVNIGSNRQRLVYRGSSGD
jgi:hypothetical protein